MKKYVIGVDVGGTNIKLGLVSAQGTVCARSFFPTSRYNSSKEKLITALSDEIKKLIKSEGLKLKDIAGVAIGLPGLIDPAKGQVVFLPNIPGWKNVPLKKILQEKLQLPVYVENDVKLITMAEWKLGAGKGVKDLVCLTLGTGVGSGLIFDGRLYRGLNNAAGELGHMPLEIEGKPCNCGGQGCFETFVGNKHLIQLANQMMKSSKMTLPVMRELANQRNPKALKFWYEAATRIGTGLVGIVNLLNPQLIIIGGGVANNEKHLFPRIREVIQQRAMSLQGKVVKIKRAQFGDDAGILGAYVLVSNDKKV